MVDTMPRVSHCLCARIALWTQVADGSFVGHLGQAAEGVSKPWDVLEQGDGTFIVANSGNHSVMCVVATLQHCTSPHWRVW